jgi:hypothetical protein
MHITNYKNDHQAMKEFGSEFPHVIGQVTLAIDVEEIDLPYGLIDSMYLNQPYYFITE